MISKGVSGLSAVLERGRLCMRLAIISAAVSLILCGVVFFAADHFYKGLIDVFYMGLFPFFFALIFSCAAILRARFFCKMLEEEEEKILLEQRKENVASILDISEDVRFSAQRHLQNFDKYFPSVLAVISVIPGALLVYLYWTKEALAAEELVLDAGVLRNLAFLGIVCAVFAFFGGIFLTGQSRVREYRWLRPVGSMQVFGGIVMLFSAAAALLQSYGISEWNPYLARIVLFIECVVTVEFLISFVIEFYRPRSSAITRPVYESRLLTIFAEPGGVMRNIALALDYQFGFNISNTSVYLFLRKVFVPTLMFWALLLWIFTAIGEVGPGEIGIRERFGKACGSDLAPGVHLKLPWPFERIVIVPVDKLQSVVVGRMEPDGSKSAGHGNERVMLWNGETHLAKEAAFLVGGSETRDKESSFSEALLETSFPIYYRAKRDKVRDYAYQTVNIPESLLAIGQAEATAYLASSDFFKVISTDRDKACRDLQIRIQDRCDALDMGIEIVSVDMKGAHPPIGKAKSQNAGKDAFATDVAEAFQLPIIALENAKTVKLDAEATACKLNREAVEGKAKILADAEVERDRTTKLAKADAALFLEQAKAFEQQKMLYILRTKLDFLTHDCKDIRKFLLSKELKSRIYEFNFEEKARLDLLEDGGLDLNKK